mmetsp:Transcript_111981/g.219512  ORF Transcript_111981/g.219512 Transcript_111981/m.219512 type:complete len:213 (-) Transcript_111981:130-768(-)
MERVAEPAPSLAFTTSSPPNWMRWVRAATSSGENLAPGTWESRGKMVVPAWPPITLTLVFITSKPWFSATKVLARTTSKVVTPNNFLGLYTPCFFKVSAKIGTVEFTGLLITRNIASGQEVAQASARPITIPALVLNRSSLVIPGFLGTPAGMTTTLHPVRALLISSMPTCPLTLAGVQQWEISAATPGVLTTSNKDNSVTLGSNFIRSDNG